MFSYEKINTFKKYQKLLSTGLFWEFYPQLTGNWEIDKYKIK